MTPSQLVERIQRDCDELAKFLIDSDQRRMACDLLAVSQKLCEGNPVRPAVVEALKEIESASLTDPAAS